MPPGYHTIHSGRGKSHIRKFGNHSQAKPCFQDLLKTRPRPSREPDFGFQATFWILGPKCGPWVPKQKRCAPENHPEPRLQNKKWSHVMQVMAGNHSEQAKPNQAKPGLKLRGQVVYQPIKLSRTFVIHQYFDPRHARPGPMEAHRESTTNYNHWITTTGR